MKAMTMVVLVFGRTIEVRELAGYSFAPCFILQRYFVLFIMGASVFHNILFAAHILIFVSCTFGRYRGD